MVDASTIVPTSVQRNLADKLYEKRKNAALEIEGIVKQLASAAEHDKIAAVINLLSTDFTSSPQANHRKGGLIGLAAVTVGLTSEAGSHLEAIVTPVLGAFMDQDSRVRYYACEALYNIAKVVRGEFIIYFNKIFDALCKLSADSDANVQSAAHLLDRLVKDIVTESDSFSIEEFIPLLRERMNVLNPFVRQFLVGWITVLDSVPDIDMLGFLPDFLDGLFNMLSDSSLEIRQQADSALSEFLQEIKSSPSVDYGRMAEILVRRAGSNDEFTRLTAIVWINEFVKLGGYQLVPYYADILEAILPCISDKEEKIRVVASETNEELRRLRPEAAEGFDVRAILKISIKEINSEYEPTRIEALNWLQALVSKYRNEVLVDLKVIFDALLNALSDPSEEVILLVLKVYACVAQESLHFTNLVKYLLTNFKSNTLILEKRGPLVVRQLCVLLGAEKVYREFSTLLENEPDLDFANIMVQALNLILVTSSELAELRAMLKNSLVNDSGKDLLLSLYLSWCHCPMATITLCLLAQAYHHTSCVIESLREEDLNVKFLVQLDKLVRLLETPIFSYLRLQLLEPEKHTWLLKSLYGLLMLLPQLSSLYVEQEKGYTTKQSSAFKVLRTRLKTIPANYLREDLNRSYSNKIIPITNNNNDNNNQEEAFNNVYDSINFESLLERFVQTQDMHREYSKSKPAQLSLPAPVPVTGTGTGTGTGLAINNMGGSSSQDKYWEFRKLQLEMLQPKSPVVADASPSSQEPARLDSRPTSPIPEINRPSSRTATRSFQ